jgi:hypothetical protein
MNGEINELTSEAIAQSRARRWPLFIGVAIVALTIFALPASATSGGQSGLAAARTATARFHELDAAKAAGYTVRVADNQGLTCIADPHGAGAMGVHYLDPNLAPELFDPQAAARIDAGTPELLVYAPGANHTQRLVALEYLTLKAPWDAQHGGPPSLFGHRFNEVPAGNRFGLPAFYSLHAWVWARNPTDLFAQWNPRVTCP